MSRACATAIGQPQDAAPVRALQRARQQQPDARAFEQGQERCRPALGRVVRILALGHLVRRRQVVHLVHDEQRSPAPCLGEVQVWGSGDTLVGGHVASQTAGRVGRVVGRAHREGVAECRAPVRVGERLLGLQAQAVARDDPDHVLDEPCRDESMGGQHRQQRLATAGRDRGQDVAHLRARGDRLRDGEELRLVRAEGARHSLPRTHRRSDRFFRF